MDDIVIALENKHLRCVDELNILISKLLSDSVQEMLAHLKSQLGIPAIPTWMINTLLKQPFSSPITLILTIMCQFLFLLAVSAALYVMFCHWGSPASKPLLPFSQSEGNKFQTRFMYSNSRNGATPFFLT